MKKMVAVGLMCVALLTGCGNQDIIDTNYTFNKAIITITPDETIEVKVKKWSDYEGEQVQIIAEDGTIYLTSTLNCTLINDTNVSKK